MVPSKYHTTHIKRNGQSMNFWPCVSRRKGDLLKKLVKVLLAWLKIRGRRKKEEKNHIPPIAKIKESRYFFSVKRKGTWRRTAINIRLGLEKRVIIFPLYVLNLIWLIFVMIHGLLTLDLRFIFLIPCKASQARGSQMKVNSSSTLGIRCVHMWRLLAHVDLI